LESMYQVEGSFSYPSKLSHFWSRSLMSYEHRDLGN